MGVEYPLDFQGGDNLAAADDVLLAVSDEDVVLLLWLLPIARHHHVLPDLLAIGLHVPTLVVHHS